MDRYVRRSTTGLSDTPRKTLALPQIQTSRSDSIPKVIKRVNAYTVLPDITRSTNGAPLTTIDERNNHVDSKPHNRLPTQITVNVLPVLPGITTINKNTEILSNTRVLKRNKTYTENTIERDVGRIKKLSKAEMGQWGAVWTVLGTSEKPKNDFLINVIPSGKTMGLLHHAAIQGSDAILQTLLNFKACDRTIRTRTCSLKTGETGRWDAKKLAEIGGNARCIKLLSNTDSAGEDERLDTFCSLEFDNGTFTLLNVALAVHKKIFHPDKIDPQSPVFDLLKCIFKDINSSEERWLSVKELVCLSIQDTCNGTPDTIEESNTRDDFYIAIIKTYTAEHNNHLYTELNNALRRQRKEKYRPTALDLELSPFVLMYEMILLYWDKLERESNLTYRRMLLTDADLAKYQVGIKFVWMSFISSSADEGRSQCFPTCDTIHTKGQNVVAFTFDNSRNSAWQPRNIEQYASYAEYERTYPAGACFEVTKTETKSDCTHVKLTLINT